MILTLDVTLQWQLNMNEIECSIWAGASALNPGLNLRSNLKNEYGSGSGSGSEFCI